MATEFGLARRGSGEGFHSDEAKQTRTDIHFENWMEKNRGKLYKAWNKRFEDPLERSNHPAQEQEVLVFLPSDLQADIDNAYKVDMSRFGGDSVTLTTMLTIFEGQGNQ